MSLRILAIDDSRTIRSLLRAALETAGFACETADDGVLGVESFHRSAPDLVITDLNMPRMDGIGVIEAIRAAPENRNVPILVLSTENGAEIKARARSAGATGWVSKPFDERALVTLVRRMTGLA